MRTITKACSRKHSHSTASELTLARKIQMITSKMSFSKWVMIWTKKPFNLSASVNSAPSSQWKVKLVLLKSRRKKRKRMKRKRRSKKKYQRSLKKEKHRKPMMVCTITSKTQMGFGKRFELANMKIEKLSCLTFASQHITKSKVLVSRLWMKFFKWCTMSLMNKRQSTAFRPPETQKEKCLLPNPYITATQWLVRKKRKYMHQKMMCGVETNSGTWIH